MPEALVLVDMNTGAGDVSSSVIRCRPSERAVLARGLDPESRDWLVRLRGPRAVRDRAIAELHARLRREARFHVRMRARGKAEVPSSDLDDLAVQAANDALLAILRKLDEYRGDSQFWTWARRFAQIEAPVTIRRRLGRDRLANDPALTFEVPDPSYSPEERAEVQELLRKVTELIVEQLTVRQRTVLVAIAIDGASTVELAAELDTTCGAIYKMLHDARKKLSARLVLCGASEAPKSVLPPGRPVRDRRGSTLRLI